MLLAHMYFESTVAARHTSGGIVEGGGAGADRLWAVSIAAHLGFLALLFAGSGAVAPTAGN